MNTITTDNLNFSFGRSRVIKDLGLEVPERSIYGFLGPNGAGKTTTIRLLLGLIRPGSGSIDLAGSKMPGGRIDALKKTGALIENSSLYGNLTGYENLDIVRRLCGIPKKRIAEILVMVGLTDQADKKVRKYSMGMKQRLGIGLSLIMDPEILILDEPVNGLDPQGIRDVRDMLHKLNRDEGKTIFISSHILSEIDKLATHLGVLNHGELLFQGPLSEFKKLSGGSTIIVVDNYDKADEKVKEKGYNIEKIDEHRIEYNFDTPVAMNKLLVLLIESGAVVREVYKQSVDLEELFLTLTNGRGVKNEIN